MILSIVIPTHKRVSSAGRLLESIAHQNFPYEDLQVLLISNLKDIQLRRQKPYWETVFFDFKYKEVGFVGVNKARNMGIRFARGDILYFLDDDCVLAHKNHLQNLLIEHEKRPQAIGIGGGYKALNFKYDLEKFYHQHIERWVREFVVSEKQSRQLIGGNSSYKREVFDKGFYFDPSISFGGSEESFNQSLKDQGWSLVYSEKLWVFHAIRLSWFSFVKKSLKQGMGLARNRCQQSQKKWKDLRDIQKDWAFFSGESLSLYSFVYMLCFKLGYFWELSFLTKQSGVFRFFSFILLIVKSRWYFFKEYVFLKALGGLWYVLGGVYGYVLKALGKLWYVSGWIYAHVLLFIFYRSPPMKIYYFSVYQYHKRIKPFFNKIKNGKTSP